MLGWLDQNWWDTDVFNNPQHTAPEKVPCESADMKRMVDQGYFTLSPSYYGVEEQTMIGGNTVQQWKLEYQRRIREQVGGI